MEFKTSESSRWALLLWALFLFCCGVADSAMDNYDTEYVSTKECAVMLKRSRSRGSNDPLVDGSNHYPGPGSADCIRYEDVNEALRKAKKYFGYVPRYRRSSEIDNDDINLISNVLLETSRNLAEKFRLTFDEINYALPTIDTSKTDIWDICPDMYKPTPCSATRFRAFDGQCSSLKNSVVGMARTAFKRFLPAAYSDGVSEPRLFSVDGAPLPHVRKISREVHTDINQLTQSRSALMMSWGQFILHDITFGEFATEPADGAELTCCPAANSTHPDCRPIAIAENDPFYYRYNFTCMHFQRNVGGIKPGCALGPRINGNFVTARLDLNFVYGNSDAENQILRLGTKGLMKTWPKYRSLGLKDLLPPQVQQPAKNCIARTMNKFCFLAGDTRISFQPQVASLHHVYVREHNRIATELGHLNPHWGDKRIFEETRHILIAMIQHIGYNEFLPLLVGPEYLRAFNLTLQKEGYYYGYDKNVALGTDIAMQSAAFRWGHTLVMDKFSLYNKHHKFVDAWETFTTLAQPYNLYQPGAIDKILLGSVDAPAESFDRFVTSGITKRLFQVPSSGVGRDLAAININRGRDNALPGYNDFREWCGMPRVKTFEELQYYLGNWTALLYSKVYSHPDDIDLWSAGIAEYPVTGGVIGPTFACIISRQFYRNRRGDRYWYENPGFPSSFTPGQLEQIRKITQAKIICENGDDIPTIQMWTLLLPDKNTNPRYLCKDLPQVNLEYWIEDPKTEEFKYLK